jgi:prepilin peptidase CpaA
MHTAQFIWALTLAMTLSAALLDWRSHRIPNLLTVPGLLVGVTVHTMLTGWHGTLFALEGAGLALVLLLAPVLTRVLGAGDWKLMGAVGALLGPVLMLFVLLSSVFAIGLMAFVQMTRTGIVVQTFRNMLVLVRGIFAFGLKPNPRMSLDSPGAMKLPFGVAVALATLICFCAARWVA